VKSLLHRLASTRGHLVKVRVREHDRHQAVPSPRNRERRGEQRNGATLQRRGRAGRLRTSHEWKRGTRRARGKTGAFPTIGPYPLEYGISHLARYCIDHILLARAQGTDADAREPFCTPHRTPARGRELTNRRPLIYRADTDGSSHSQPCNRSRTRSTKASKLSACVTTCSNQIASCGSAGSGCAT